MILESKKLFFKKVLVILEDDIVAQILQHSYSKIIVISQKNLALSRFNVRVKPTIVLDMTKSKEDIFKKFNDTTRNEIKRTYTMPELTFEMNIDFDNVYSLYQNFEYSQHRIPFSKGDLRQCMIFSAYYKGELIAGIFADRCNDGLRLRYIFSKRMEVHDKELYRIISYANRRLIWEVCLFSKRENLSFLDQSGVTTFKSSFGGEVINEYTYTYTSAIYSLFEKFVVIKNVVRKLFKI